MFGVPGMWCLKVVSYLVICESWTNKPLWLDEHSLLVDKLLFHIRAELEFASLRIQVLVHPYSISLA